MSAPQVDERKHATAIKTALEQTLGENPVLDLDEIPGTNGREGKVPKLFAAIELERMAPTQRRMTSQAGTSRWALTVTVGGRTVDEVRWGLFKVAQALDDQRLTINGRTTTALQYETGNAPAPQSGRYEGDSLYSFTH